MRQLTVSTTEAKEFLKNTKIFHYLSDSELDNLYSICSFVEYSEKEQIIQESEVDPTLYIIAKGTVSVGVHENKEKNVYLCSIGEGDIFGEAALFINMKRTADVYALGPTQLIQIERSNLLKFFKSLPLAGVKILMIITYSLLQKLRESNQELAFHRKTNYSQAEVDELIKGIFEE